MIKKFLFVVFTAVVAAQVWAYEEVVDGVSWTYSYEYNSRGEKIGASIASGDYSGDLVVPSTLGGCPVVGIDQFAFYGCSELTSIVLPEGVIDISIQAFCRCTNLKSIVLPDSLKTFYRQAFDGCSSLESIKIPKNVTVIDGWLFGNCTSLKSVELPSGLKEIEYSAFNGCSSLATIEIPDSVTKIGVNAFYNTPFLDNQEYGMIIFGPVLYGYKGDYPEELVVPEGVKVLGPNSLAYNWAKTITLPRSLTTIDDTALASSYEITSITIPDGVTTIGSRAFEGSRQLASVTIPDSVTMIGRDAFNDTPFYKNLPDGLMVLGSGILCGIKGDCPADIVIPEGVKAIPVEFFAEQSAITSITIPNGVTSIGEGAFIGCDSLTSITIPDSVTSIGGEYEVVLYGCSALTEINGWRPRLYSPGWDEENQREKENTIKKISISSNVTSISGGDLRGYTNLEAITIPDSVTSIGEGVLYGCSVLTEINGWRPYIYYPEWDEENQRYKENTIKKISISSSVTSISYNDFRGYTNLESMMIPTGVTEIEWGALRDLTALKTVYVEYGDTDRVKDLMRYKGEDILDVDTLQFVEPYSFDIDENGVLTGYAGNIPSELVIPEGVTKIDNAVFRDCNSLTSVMIPEGVTEIADEAFNGCSSLTKVVIPEGVKRIGFWAFKDCNSLVDIDLPDSITTMGEGVFMGVAKYELAMAKLAFGGGASSSGAANTVTVKQEIVHYVLNSVQPEFARPVSEDAGFVNVIAEVKGNNVAVPQTWTENYPQFAVKFGSDFTKALTAKSGKIAAGGREMLVWEDYVAGTDPTNPNDKFTASMTLVDGKPVISYTPELDDARKALRKYTTYGKEKLTDSEWTVVPAGEEAKYNFFKVTVEMK